MNFDDLKAAWITELYKSYSALLLPSIDKQLSTAGLILDLNSLPTYPYPFKELFIRWLISINRQRVERGAPIIITKEIVLKCPIWKIVKCPLKRVKLTKERMFNKPIATVGSIGSKPTMGSINKRK